MGARDGRRARRLGEHPQRPQPRGRPLRGSPITDGALRALSLAPGIVPVGVVFGATAVAEGFSPVAATLLSALVFAGGAQFAAVALVGQGGALVAAVALVAIINSRYFLLSAAALDLARAAGASAKGRVAMALGVVDETFALQAAWTRQGPVPLSGLLSLSATFWAMWVGATLLGAVAGGLVPALEPYGLDYALPGIFVGLLGIFADTRERAAAGLAALVVAGALALAGLGVAAVLVVPPLFAFALGRWSRAG